jgi:hypothetical protein
MAPCAETPVALPLLWILLEDTSEGIRQGVYSYDFRKYQQSQVLHKDWKRRF